jgi:exodeoxyribonuclease V alpha subunit
LAATTCDGGHRSTSLGQEPERPNKFRDFPLLLRRIAYFSVWYQTFKAAQAGQTIEEIDAVEQDVTIRFDDRLVKYDFGELDEVSLAYAVTVHKAQGSEFPAIVIPLATQHFMLLRRNLIYTGITRGKRLVVLVGQKKALAIAVRNNRTQRRYSGL